MWKPIAVPVRKLMWFQLVLQGTVAPTRCSILTLIIMKFILMCLIGMTSSWSRNLSARAPLLRPTTTWFMTLLHWSQTTCRDWPTSCAISTTTGRSASSVLMPEFISHLLHLKKLCSKDFSLNCFLGIAVWVWQWQLFLSKTALPTKTIKCFWSWGWLK